MILNREDGCVVDGEAFQRAVAVLDTAGRIEPNAGIYHALKGRVVHVPQTERALDHFRKALKDDAPVPAPPARPPLGAAAEWPQ